MRIARLIALLMMHTMCCDPKDRSTLECHCSTDSKEVLKPLGHIIRPVGMKTVISQADSETDADPVQYKPGDDRRGCNKKECSNRADVKE